MKIRVMFVIGTLDVGGTERQLVELVLGLDRSRFEPMVCCLSAGGPLRAPLDAQGIPLHVAGFVGFRRTSGASRGFLRTMPEVVRSVRRIRTFIRQHRPHIVHGLLFWAYVIGAVVARSAGVPVVLASRRSLGHFKAGKPHYLLLERAVNRLTDLVVANSEAVRQDAVRRESLPPQKVVVIHNGVQSGRFRAPADERLRASLGLRKGSPVVGVIANFIHYKGYGYFLEAWGAIAAKFPDTTALLVGEGRLRGEFEARAAAMGLAESVRFLGTRHDVPALLALMDLVVHPSLEEGFSNTILEAMAAGKPVVATAVGGNVEAVVHGQTGLLVPPHDSEALADAMRWFFEHAAEAVEFGEAGRRRVAERFELSDMVRRYEALYEDVVDGRRPTAGPRGRGVTSERATER